MKRTDGPPDEATGETVPGEEASAPRAGADEPKGLEPRPVPPVPDELAALRAERDELKDLYLRKSADFDNFRKRAERDRQQRAVEATGALLRDLIPTLDNLDRALAAEGSETSLREGVELTRRELLALMEARGVAAEDPLHQPFDPSRHQAFSYEPAPGFADGTVVEVLRRGYRTGDRLLRPALVKVARGPEDDGGGEADRVH